MANKRDLIVGIDGDPKGFDAAAKSAEESAKVFDRELGRLERQLAMSEERTKAITNAVEKFGREENKAALAARKLGNEAERAAEKAARAQAEYAEAAEKLADGEGDAARAEELQARAAAAVERAAIKAAEAHRAQARAADQAADQERQLARDAEIAAAAQTLGALKARGALEQHNALLRQVQRRFPELEKDASGAFTAMTSAGGRFGQSLGSLTSGMEELSGVGRVMPGVIIAGLQLLPAAAAVAGGAMSLALGGAITAIGIKFAAENKQVRADWGSLGKEIANDFRQDSEPFVGVLRHIAAEGRTEFRSWQPLIKQEFAASAPYVDSFVAQAIGSLDELKPAFHSVMHSFDVQLAALGPQLPGIMHNLSTAIEAVTNAAAKNPQALGDMLKMISLVARGVGDAVGFLIRFEHQLNTTFEVVNGFAMGPLGLAAAGILKMKQAVDSGSGSLQIGQGSFQSFGSQAVQTGISTGHLATAMQLAALSAKEMAAALDAASGKAISEREALVAYRQSVVAMTQALKENGHAHGFATAKGAANEAALDGMAVAAQKAAAAMKSDGRSAQQVSSFLEGARQRIIAAAEKMHYSAAAARELASKLLGVAAATRSIPTSHSTRLNNNAAAAASQIRSYQHWINSLHGKTIYVHTVYTSSGSTTFGAGNRKLGNRRGGLFHKVGFAGGGDTSGLVRGPGGPVSDSIPAPFLSDKEFVVQAKYAMPNLSLLEAINSGKRISMGMNSPRPVATRARGGDGASLVRPAPVVLEIRSGGSRLDDALVGILRTAVKAKGGDVQVVLGS